MLYRGFESWPIESATKPNRIMQDDTALLRISNGVRPFFHILVLDVTRIQTQRANIDAFLESFEALPHTLSEFNLEN